MIRIAVDTGERPYEVLIGSDLLDAAGAQLVGYAPGGLGGGGQ
jgi:hypothetical protein